MIGRLLVVVAAILFASASATAQVGIFSRADCTTLVAPSTGQTFCFDQTANQLKSWSGGTWKTIVQTTDATPALTAVANGGGVAVSAIVNSGSGIALRGESVSRGAPAIVGASSGYYAGLFYNITDLGSDLANANAIGLVGQSVYSNAFYAQQGGAPGSPGEILRRDNIYPAAYVTRVAGKLNGFNFTAPLLRVDDTTASTGRLADAVKRGTTVFSLYGSGAAAFGTANVLQGSFVTFQSSARNEGLAMHNTAPADGASTPLWLVNKNAANTTSNVSVEALSTAGAGADMVFRTGATAQTSLGAERMRIKSSGETVMSGDLQVRSAPFTSLGSPASGTIVFCADCDPATNAVCTSAGAKTGAFAFRVNRAWKCLG
jgi:hypothetical protein